jgi:hypothetical protein
MHQGSMVFMRDGIYWKTAPNDFYQFQYTDDEDSAIATRLTSKDGTLVIAEWAMASAVLVVGTRDSEWIIRGQNVYDPLTVAGKREIADGTEGSCPHIPVAVDDGIVFIGRSRRRLHYAPFDRLSEKVDSDEITVSARHILKGKASQIAYQRDPHRVLWVSCQNGDLRSVTFMPKQSVIAPARHPMTNGFVEDVKCLPSSDEAKSDTYLIVRRVINGQTHRYIEMLADFFEAANEDAPDAVGAWFVDCGLRYQGPAISTVGGLSHLEGQTVRVFVNGAQQSDKVVSAGQITLDAPGTDILIGLPIRWRAKSLPIDISASGGSTKGQKKRSPHALIDVLESAGGKAAVNDGLGFELKYNSQIKYGAAIPLTTGAIVVPMLGGHADEMTIDLYGDDAMPFTLLGFSLPVQLPEVQG